LNHHFIEKTGFGNQTFAKTGSGQTYGKTPGIKRETFSSCSLRSAETAGAAKKNGSNPLLQLLERSNERCEREHKTETK
jgi:hypothetical protein